MKNFIKNIIIKLNVINIFSIFFYVFRIFKIKNNKIACTNFSGKGYGDNPKYILEELLKSDNKYDIVWFVKDVKKSKFPEGVRPVKIYSIKYYYEMVTAKIWINNSRFPLFVRKRKGQYYVQTWHGGLGLKKIEKDAEETLSEYYKKAAPHDSKMIDLAISNSKYRTDIFKNSFWYNGEILEAGCPRNDIFFRETEKDRLNKKIRRMYNIKDDKKIILYAPTFRKSSSFDYFSIDVNNLLDKMEEVYNEEYVYLIKLHPRLSEKKIPENARIVNVTKYPDVDELLMISDILISDYSSVLFDFLYTNNPVYLYSPDYKEYLDERGINFVYNELPFSISYNTDELVKNIVENDSRNYEGKLKEFLDEMKIKDDGNASKRVVEVMNNIMKGGASSENL